MKFNWTIYSYDNLYDNISCFCFSSLFFFIHNAFIFSLFFNCINCCRNKISNSNHMVPTKIGSKQNCLSQSCTLNHGWGNSVDIFSTIIWVPGNHTNRTNAIRYIETRIDIEFEFDFLCFSTREKNRLYGPDKMMIRCIIQHG